MGSSGNVPMTSLLDQIVGHENLIQRFLQSFVNGTLPHAMLFVGPSGVGKRKTALALSQVLLCRDVKSKEGHPAACGICSSCMAISREEDTESLIVINSEKNQIKIEEAHRVLSFFNLKALRARRVIIINDADLLNPQAANSLLKILEEPPADTFFFLIAPSAVHVIATLRSRSQVMSFAPLTPEQLQSKSRAPEWAVRASKGSFERLAQVTDKEELESRQQAIRFLQTWLEEPQGYLASEVRDLIRDRTSSRALAKQVSWLFRDAFYVSQGESQYALNLDQKDFLQSLSQSLTAQMLLSSCQKAINLEAQLDANQDPSLVFESFWIETRSMLESSV